MLDLIAAITSLGNATHQIANDPLRETGLSQVFVAIDPRTLENAGTLGDAAAMDKIANEVIDSLHRSAPAHEDNAVRYPGENTLRLRAENRRLGLPVEEAVWQEIMRI
jgi:3-dehydro-L-gulonate 2-dehydrogenase